MKEFAYYLITERNLYRNSLEQVAARAEGAGVHYFQLREKDLRSRQILDLARKVRRFLVQTKFIVNGRIDVALAAGADGVHLQAGNIPVHAARKAAPRLLIGFSAHSRQDMKNAEAEGADYLLLSPVFLPLSKAANLHPIGIRNLIEWSSDIRIPVFALGGVSVHNLTLLQEAGCSGAAGISMFVKDGEFSRDQMVNPC
jgi:thiamine-phosphate pyrophosphorylase